MIRRSAFTLVELLVVIAIISLLIAIITPTLGAVKGLAWSAYCKTTLNALNKSSLVYADQNRGYMMVYTHDTSSGGSGQSYPAAPPQPSKSTIAFIATSGLNPASGFYSSARNYGLVYAARILTEPGMFYCPAPISDERHRLISYPKPWGARPTTAGGTQWVRCGYMWNPWIKKIELPGGHSVTTFDDELIVERHDPRKFLTCDLLWGRRVSGHVEGSTCHWNLAYPDGHLLQFESPELWELYLSGVRTDTDWWRWDDITKPELEKRI